MTKILYTDIVKLCIFAGNIRKQ